MKKKRGMKKMLIALLIIAALLAGGCAFSGWNWGWGPFGRLHHLKMAKLPGNARAYALSTVEEQPGSPLKGKRILFLGSSVTYGSASMGVSFADYICRRNGAEMIKEAVSGTTLVDNGGASYIARLKRLDKKMPVDLFVCQLSTNDAWTQSALGEIKGPQALDDYDTATVLGAVEYIAAYVRETWNCPVVFYASPRFESEKYDQMVTGLHEMSERWGFSVIDMWNDAAFCQLTAEQKALYQADDIHPTQAGYLKWWVPYMEPVLLDAVKQ